MEYTMHKLHQHFFRLLNEHIDLSSCPIRVRTLASKESIGDPAPWRDFALVRGQEKLIEANLKGAKGQAFTSSPSNWEGPLEDILKLDLSKEADRAIFIAALNALGRYLDIIDKTVHCRDRGPYECAKKLASEIFNRIGPSGKVTLIGYQPAFTNALCQRFGPEKVTVLDLNPENIGKEKFGIIVKHGDLHLNEAASWCDLGLATGSVIVNGTFKQIKQAFDAHKKDLIFFGTTIAAPSFLLNLKRLCFEAT